MCDMSARNRTRRPFHFIWMAACTRCTIGNSCSLASTSPSTQRCYTRWTWPIDVWCSEGGWIDTWSRKRAPKSCLWAGLGSDRRIGWCGRLSCLNPHSCLSRHWKLLWSSFWTVSSVDQNVASCHACWWRISDLSLLSRLISRTMCLHCCI